jgi:hypothetical protein
VGLERGLLSPCEDKWGATFKKVGIRRADHATPLYPQKFAPNFVDKWQSISRYTSLGYYGPRNLFVFENSGHYSHCFGITNSPLPVNRSNTKRIENLLCWDLGCELQCAVLKRSGFRQGGTNWHRDRLFSEVQIVCTQSALFFLSHTSQCCCCVGPTARVSICSGIRAPTVAVNKSNKLHVKQVTALRTERRTVWQQMGELHRWNFFPAGPYVMGSQRGYEGLQHHLTLTDRATHKSLPLGKSSPVLPFHLATKCWTPCSSGRGILHLCLYLCLSLCRSHM